MHAARGHGRSAVLAVTIAVVIALGGCTWIRQVSVSTSGAPANLAGDGSIPAVSRDGHFVAFESGATNLVSGASGGLFVRDTLANTTSVASVRSNGSFGDGSDPAISPDGRYVAFDSSDPNMVTGVGGISDQIYVRDRSTNVTRLVSVGGHGGRGNDDSDFPAISANGRYVAFESDASNLVSNDTNGSTDVFVRDLVAGTTTRVDNVDGTGQEPFFGADTASISDDGRYVAFDSLDNLTPQETSSQDVYVHDMVANTTTLVSVGPGGALSNGFSSSPRISADGHSVAFVSTATNLDTVSDTNAQADVFVRTLTTNTTTRVSRSALNGPTDGTSDLSTVSGDGRYVAYASNATNIVSGDTNKAWDAFVYDTTTRTTVRIDTDQFGSQAATGGFDPVLSGDGGYVAFVSDTPVTNLAGDSGTQVYLRHVVVPTVTKVAPASIARGSTTTLTVTGSGFLPGVSVLLGNGGLKVLAVTRTSEQSLSVSVAAAVGAPTGPGDVRVTDPGTGPGATSGAVGSCAGCLTVT